MNCEICNCKIKIKKNWNRHVQSKKHQRNLLSTTPIEDVIEDVTEEDNTVVITVGEKKALFQLIENQTKIIEEMKIEMMKMKQPTTTNNNTTNNNTLNNNITINFYGQENYKELLTSANVKELQGGNLLNIVNSMLRICYIDREENRNIQFTNLRSNTVKVLTEDGWEARNVNKVFGERLKNVGNIYPVTMTEYDDNTKEDVDDLLVMTQEIKRIANSGDRYILDDKSSYTKEQLKDLTFIKDQHLNEVYNNSGK